MFMEHDSVTQQEHCANIVQNRVSNKCSFGSNYGVREKAENSGCHTWGLKNYPLAMVYVPLQEFDELYDLETALNEGTVFKKFDLPFKGESINNSGKGGSCRG